MSFSMVVQYDKALQNRWLCVNRFIIAKQEDDLSFESKQRVLQRLHNYLVVYFHHANKRAP